MEVKGKVTSKRIRYIVTPIAGLAVYIGARGVAQDGLRLDDISTLLFTAYMARLGISTWSSGKIEIVESATIDDIIKTHENLGWYNTKMIYTTLTGEIENLRKSKLGKIFSGSISGDLTDGTGLIDFYLPYQNISLENGETVSIRGELNPPHYIISNAVKRLLRIKTKPHMNVLAIKKEGDKDFRQVDSCGASWIDFSVLEEHRTKQPAVQ